MTMFRLSYHDERGDEIEIITIEVPGADRAAIPLDARHLRVRVSRPDPEVLTCCGAPMGYEEFAHVRRYHCTHRHHPVVYVDQETGLWERREY